MDSTGASPAQECRLAIIIKVITVTIIITLVPLDWDCIIPVIIMPPVIPSGRDTMDIPVITPTIEIITIPPGMAGTSTGVRGIKAIEGDPISVNNAAEAPTEVVALTEADTAKAIEVDTVKAGAVVEVVAPGFVDKLMK